MLDVRHFPQILLSPETNTKPALLTQPTTLDPPPSQDQNWTSIALPSVSETSPSFAQAGLESATVGQPSVTYSEIQNAFSLPSSGANWPLAALACAALISRILPKLGFKLGR